ncbi:MAG: tetratricopeptide repeat protein [bacterium]|nr:tetratricopeptide repeat protein [bacterium]
MVSLRISPKILLVSALILLGVAESLRAQDQSTLGSPDSEHGAAIEKAARAMVLEELERRTIPERIKSLLIDAENQRDEPGRCLELATTALDRLQALPDAGRAAIWARAFALALRSWGHQGAGNYQSARTMADEAYDIAARLDDDTLIAEAQYYRAVAEWRLADHNAALAHASEAFEIQQQHNDLRALGRTLSLLGIIHRSTSELDLSIEYHLEALTLGEELGDEIAIARASNNVGLVYWKLERLDDAEQALKRAFEINTRLGRLSTAARSASNIGLILIEQGWPEKALPLLEEAQTVYEKNDDRLGLALVLGNLGFAHEKLDDRDVAIDYAKRSLAIRLEIGAKHGIVRIRGTLGRLYLDAGDTDAARDQLEEALGLAAEIGARNEQAEILRLLADLHQELGAFKKALELHREFHKVHTEIAGEKTLNRIAILEANHERKRRQREIVATRALAATRAEQRDWFIAGSALLTVCLIALAGLYLARSRAQRAVAESERRYRRLFENSTTPTFVIERNSRTLIDSNASARSLCSRVPIPDDPATERGPIMIESIEPEWVRVALARMIDEQDHAAPALDDCWIERSGRLRWTEVRGCAVTLQGRECQLITVRDTTEQRAHEQARLREDKMEALGLLAGGIAHDFNNVLTSIIGHVGLARDGSEAEREEMLEFAERAAIQARRLTSQLLAFSKGGEPVRRSENVGTVLREAIEFATAGSPLQVTLAVADDLWPALLDSGQFSQVVSNLVINAQQATGKAGRLRIHASNHEGAIDRTTAAGRYVRIDFADNGPGIPEHIRDHILDPYFTTKNDGSGLGLATAYAIVKHHGGVLRFESREGHGTTFSTFFPATRESVPAVTRPEPGEPAGNGSVLVLDDEELVRSVIAKTFERWGFRVEAVADGRFAVERYRERHAAGQPFDLLVMDLTIPGGMGGREAMAAILAIDPHAKAIVASGYSDDPTMARYREAGFAAALAKPFRREDLASTVTSVLGESHHHRAKS